MENRKIHVAITHGDTNGIGYELIFKTFSDPSLLELCTPVIYGSPKVATYHRNALNLQANFTIISKPEDARDGKINMLTTFDDEIKVELGNSTPESTTAALKAINRAISDYEKNAYDVLVTAPVNEEVMQTIFPDILSQSQYLAQKSSASENMLSILTNNALRIAILTPRMPITRIPSVVSKEMIVSKTKLFNEILKRDFSISCPRIAILSLNPQASGGNEENKVINPAITELEEHGVQAFGPYPADAFFGNSMQESFDGVMAMYYDQGMIPFMTIDQGSGTGYTAGLPFVCTCPLYDSTGNVGESGNVNESSFRHAIYNAIDIFRNRIYYEEPFKDPLKKLYHEKKDDSEKVRFTLPKSKNENTAAE